MLSDKPSSAWFIRDSMWRKSKPLMLESQKKIMELLNLFEDSENVHNLGEGVPIKLEQIILQDTIMMASEFIHKLRLREINLYDRTKALQISRRMSAKPVLRLQSHAFPEVLSNEVMSYLPAVYRWDSLRQKYDYEFLTKGLKQKTIPRINIIFKNFFQAVKLHIAYIKQHEGTTFGPFAVHDPNRLDFLRESYNEWSSAVIKMEKIEVIVSLYRTLELAHLEPIIKKSVYNDFCSKMITILHMLVIAVKPSPKKPRVRKVKIAMVDA